MQQKGTENAGEQQNSGLMWVRPLPPLKLTIVAASLKRIKEDKCCCAVAGTSSALATTPHYTPPPFSPRTSVRNDPSQSTPPIFAISATKKAFYSS
jgi:hypothetical protein